MTFMRTRSAMAWVAMVAVVAMMAGTTGLAGAQAPAAPGATAARPAQPALDTTPKEIPLWEHDIPGALGTAEADIPTLTIYPAARRASGTAVVVAPGGGYSALAMDHEGRQVAAFFNSMGVSAFVLKYRLGPKYHHPIELGDAQRAMRIVRSRAQSFGVVPTRIGMMGFSAGGHLASTAATHFDAGKPDAADAIDRVSSRPDFLILGYPVISSDPAIAHAGSFKNLLGENAGPEAAGRPVERSARDAGNAADVHLPDQRRHGGPGRERRPFLSRAAQGEGRGGNAHLRERAARRRALARRSGAEPLADPSHELAPGPGAAHEAVGPVARCRASPRLSTTTYTGSPAISRMNPQYTVS